MDNLIKCVYSHKKDKNYETLQNASFSLSILNPILANKSIKIKPKTDTTFGNLRMACRLI